MASLGHNELNKMVYLPGGLYMATKQVPAHLVK